MYVDILNVRKGPDIMSSPRFISKNSKRKVKKYLYVNLGFYP